MLRGERTLRLSVLSLDSVEFETADLELLGDEDGVRFWRTGDNDQVTLHFFPLPPDIPAALDDVDELRRRYVAGSGHSDVSIIFVDPVSVAERPALRVIGRVPQNPTGMTYIGSITLPFRDCSFVIKGQCAEVGMTGMRDTLVFTERTAQFVEESDRAEAMNGWRLPPEDPLGGVALPRNLSEGEEYDGQFPTHPLSRLRRILSTVQTTVTLAPEMERLEPFEYRPRSNRRWWNRQR
jgi:hypothetical protein